MGAAVGRGDEHHHLDAGRPARPRQHGLHERPGHQSAAAVADHVDHQALAGAVGTQPLEQVLGVLPRVEAQRLVVEADHRVVRRDGGAQEPLAVLVDAPRAERPGGGGERPVHEQQHPHRSVAGSIDGQAHLRQRLDALPSLDVGVGEVHQARTDVVLHRVDRLLHQHRRHEPEHQRLRRPLHEAPEESPRPVLLGPTPTRPGAACCVLGRGCGLHRDLEPGRARSGLQRPGPLGAVDRQVPGVDTVALHQHHRVLPRRHVHLELHGPALRGRLVAELLGPPRGQVDALDELELALGECPDQHVAARARRTGKGTPARGGRRVVGRRSRDAERASRKGGRHASLPPGRRVHVPANLERHPPPRTPPKRVVAHARGSRARDDRVPHPPQHDAHLEEEPCRASRRT